MKRIQDKLTMAMVLATGGIIIEKSRRSGWFEKRAYHARCFHEQSYIPRLSWMTLYFLLPDELSKHHWNKRQCHRCQRLVKGPPPELT